MEDKLSSAIMELGFVIVGPISRLVETNTPQISKHKMRYISNSRMQV